MNRRLPAWWPWPVVAGLLLTLALVSGGDEPTGPEPAAEPYVWPKAKHPAARPEAELTALRRRVRSSLGPLASAQGTRLGVIVLGPGDGETLFEHHADRPFVPASNAKLFSTGAAWVVLLDPRRQTLDCLRTQLFTRGEVRDGTLHGDVVVQGGGDPGLSPRVHGGSPSHPCSKLAKAIRDEGITRVTGDVVLDDGLFDREFTHPSWKDDQRTLGYQAQVSALCLNDACIRVAARPGSAVGDPAVVTWEPRCDAVTVTSTVTTAKKGTRSLIDCRREAGTNRVSVRGKIALGSAGESGLCTIHDPPLVFGSVLARALSEAGIRVEGTVRVEARATRDPSIPPLVELASDFHRALVEANRNSHNLTADCLLKRMASRAREPESGSFAGGAAALLDGLRAADIDTAGFDIVDGSGLSPENRCTPRQVAGWLRYVRALPDGEQFAETLAAGGQGTLRRRLRARDVKDRVRMKTGTLDGVRALSGYVEHPRYGRLIISILARGADPTVRWALVERLARLGG